MSDQFSAGPQASGAGDSQGVTGLVIERPTWMDDLFDEFDPTTRMLNRLDELYSTPEDSEQTSKIMRKEFGEKWTLIAVEWWGKVLPRLWSRRCELLDNEKVCSVMIERFENVEEVENLRYKSIAEQTLIIAREKRRASEEDLQKGLSVRDVVARIVKLKMDGKIKPREESD